MYDRFELIVWGERLLFGIICGEFIFFDGGWVYSVVFLFFGNIFVYVCKLILLK